MAPRTPGVTFVLFCAGALPRLCCGDASGVSGGRESFDEFSSLRASDTRAAQQCDVPGPVSPPEELDFLRSPALLFGGCLCVLVLGYLVYGSFVEKQLQPNDTKPTPAMALQDGMDFCPMSDARVFLIQLLNIAGLGPIFGPIQGAQFGPSALVWIVFGAVFFGAVMDYLIGMMSIRTNGASITTLVGNELGQIMLALLNAVSLLLLMGVGVIFVKGPSEILGNITWGSESEPIWSGVVFIYYIVATLVPVDKIIGRFYPVFGAALVFMTLGLIAATIASGRAVPEMQPLQSDGTWPYPSIVVIISCGAISGFHATQTPMMARCITSQGSAKKVFYGAMITEGVIGLIWAITPLIFFGGQAELTAALGCGSPATIVQHMCTYLLGSLGGAFAIVGVVALPITSGDTAFRSARLIVAEIVGTTNKQQEVRHRLFIAVPMFLIAFSLTFVDFQVMWQYFNFVNQIVSTMALWTGASFLKRNGKNHFVASVPASLLTFFLGGYIFKSREFGTADNSLLLALALGAFVTVVIVGGMCVKLGRTATLATPTAISDDAGTGFELSADEKAAAVQLVRRDSMRGAARL